MGNEQTYHNIKAIVHDFLPSAQVLLFGSRAREKYSNESDYDLLLVTEEDYAPKEKRLLESKIRKALVWSLNSAVDVILQSQQELDKYKDSKGYILYYALKDAISI